VRACDLSLGGGQVSGVDADLQKVIKRAIAGLAALNGSLEFFVRQPTNKVILTGWHGPFGEKDWYTIFRHLYKQAQEVAAQAASSDEVAWVVVELACSLPVGREVCDLQWTASERCDYLVARRRGSNSSRCHFPELLELPVKTRLEAADRAITLLPNVGKMSKSILKVSRFSIWKLMFLKSSCTGNGTLRGIRSDDFDEIVRRAAGYLLSP
jgi:hypothetical protein